MLAPVSFSVSGYFFVLTYNDPAVRNFVCFPFVRVSVPRARSRREEKVRAGSAVVMDLPSSAVEDPSPFVPPSQYEVSVCCDSEGGADCGGVGEGDWDGDSR